MSKEEKHVIEEAVRLKRCPNCGENYPAYLEVCPNCR